jgi:hypothetical protein
MPEEAIKNALMEALTILQDHDRELMKLRVSLQAIEHLLATHPETHQLRKELGEALADARTPLDKPIALKVEALLDTLRYSC